MPSFVNTAFNTFFKRIFQVNQSSNTGVDATTRNVQTGDGVNTSISISDDVLQVQPQTHNTTGAFLVKNQGGSNILAIDTTNSAVKAGASQVNALTQYKEFGMHELDVQTGYHTALVAGNMVRGIDDDTNWSADDSTFSNGADPATTVDLSANGTASNLTACLWYIMDNITIDQCRFMTSVKDVTARDINMHVMTYTLDTSTNFGDLSSGLVVADGTTNVTSTTLKTGTLSNTSNVDIDAGKVVVCTVENEGSTSEVTCQIIIKYHIR